MEDGDLPSYMVHAFQIHQEQGGDGEAEDIDITYREKNFPIGSIFSFPIQSASPSLQASDNEWNVGINPASFHLGKGAQLTIDTLALDPSTQSAGSASLFISTDVDPDYSCLCPNLSSPNGNTMVTALGLSVIGPATVHLALVNSLGINCDNKESGLQIVNVFGKVQAVSSDIQDLVSIAKHEYSEIEAQEKSLKQVDGILTDKEQDIEIKETENTTSETSDKKISEKKKKRKLNDAEELPTTTGDSIEICDPISVEPQKLSKKQRRKLAKQKEKQLQDIVAQENDHQETKDTAKETTPGKKTSLTRPRMIKGGIVVQDIVQGNGASVKTGRKVSINYIGTFPASGKVFDKNMGKSKPLTFRVGTGEVIKGLDRGLEGMKVNGERVIKIPSELGYGSKGAGDIPPNSALCFTVHLRSVGGRS